MIESLKEQTKKLTSWDLTDRQICDIEMLLNGAFSPLEGFLNEADYHTVLNDMKLANNQLWPVPITLDVSKSFANSIALNENIALRDPEGVLIATMEIESIWQPDKEQEANAIFGQTNPNYHPAIHYLFHKAGEFYIGGKLKKSELPIHYDFLDIRRSPNEMKRYFEKLGWAKVVAFQSSEPIHREQQEYSSFIAKKMGLNLLIQAVAGMMSTSDMKYYTKIRCFKAILKKYPEQTSKLNLLHFAERLAGVREEIWNALVNKNYGCTHYIVHTQHALNIETRKILNEYKAELDIQLIYQEEMVYIPDQQKYIEKSKVTDATKYFSMTNKEAVQRLQESLNIPDWYSYPEVMQEFKKSFPPRHQQGFTLFFTGLSGSGKSTIAQALMVKLNEIGTRPVTLLDGDLVRKNLSTELTFSKEHRNINVRRIGYVASEITKNGGIAICALIAPYHNMRKDVRELIEAVGGFIEIHVSTPLEVCERRDRKGLYAKARAGLIKDFTGVNDTYEIPQHAELVIDSTTTKSHILAQEVILLLEQKGYLVN